MQAPCGGTLTKTWDKVAIGGTGSPAWAGTGRLALSAPSLPQISTQTTASHSNKPVEGMN